MKEKKNNTAESSNGNCNDRQCPIHGGLKVRGRNFKGYVIRKFDRRVTIEFERIVKVRKYERYYITKTKIHARLPNCMKEQVNIGDYIEIGECRPLSKMLHFVAIKKIKNAGEK